MSNEENEVQGPRRKAPAYYIGETYRGRMTVHPDAERHKNGAIVGTRDKAARRMIRKAFGRALSRIEQHILKARDARLELESYATNGHEAKRYVDKGLSELHKPLPAFVSRSEARAKTRKQRTADRTREQELRVKRAEVREAAAAFAALRSTQYTLEKATGEKTLKVDDNGRVV